MKSLGFKVLIIALLTASFWLLAPGSASATINVYPCTQKPTRLGLFQRIFRDFNEGDCSAYKIDKDDEDFVKSINLSDVTCGAPGDLQSHVAGDWQVIQRLGGDTGAPFSVTQMTRTLTSTSLDEDQHQNLVAAQRFDLLAHTSLSGFYNHNITKWELNTGQTVGSTKPERYSLIDTWTSMASLPILLNNINRTCEFIMQCNADPTYSRNCYNEYDVVPGQTSVFLCGHELPPAMKERQSMSEQIKAWLELPENTRNLLVSLLDQKAEEYGYTVVCRSVKQKNNQDPSFFDRIILGLLGLSVDPQCTVIVSRIPAAVDALSHLRDTADLFTSPQVNQTRFSQIHGPHGKSVGPGIIDGPFIPKEAYPTVAYDAANPVIADRESIWLILNKVNLSEVSCESYSAVATEFAGGRFDAQSKGIARIAGSYGLSLPDLGEALSNLLYVTTVWFVGPEQLRQFSDYEKGYSGKGNSAFWPLFTPPGFWDDSEALGVTSMCQNPMDNNIEDGRTDSTIEVIDPGPPEITREHYIEYTVSAGQVDYKGCNTLNKIQNYVKKAILPPDNVAWAHQQRFHCDNDYWGELSNKDSQVAGLMVVPPGPACGATSSSIDPGITTGNEQPTDPVVTDSSCQTALGIAGYWTDGTQIDYANPNAIPNIESYRQAAIDLAKRWYGSSSDLNEGPHPPVEQYIDQVIRTCQSSGFNPGFCLALWIEESAAGGAPGAFDFGCIFAPEDTPSQLSCFSGLLRSYTSYFGHTPTFEEFTLIFSEGYCPFNAPSCQDGRQNMADDQRHTYCTNPNFMRNLRTVYITLFGNQGIIPR